MVDSEYLKILPMRAKKYGINDNVPLSNNTSALNIQIFRVSFVNGISVSPIVKTTTSFQ